MQSPCKYYKQPERYELLTREATGKTLVQGV